MAVAADRLQSEDRHRLSARFKSLTITGDGAMHIAPEDLSSLAQALRDQYGFSMLSNLTAVDYEDRYVVVYHLVRPEDADICTLETEVNHQRPSLPSLTPIWGAADWQEREVYDLMGISFTGHPNLKRILLDEGFSGHPLCKSFQTPRKDR